MVFESICWAWAYLTAPIHELGHLVFGWLSFCSTVPVAWNKVLFLVGEGRDIPFLGSLGGNIGAFLFPVFIVWKFRHKGWCYPVFLWHLLAVTVTIPNQADLDGHQLRGMAELIWYLCAGLALVLGVGIWVKAQDEKLQRLQSQEQHAKLVRRQNLALQSRIDLAEKQKRLERMARLNLQKRFDRRLSLERRGRQPAASCMSDMPPRSRMVWYNENHEG